MQGIAISVQEGAVRQRNAIAAGRTLRKVSPSYGKVHYF